MNLHYTNIETSLGLLSEAEILEILFKEKHLSNKPNRRRSGENMYPNRAKKKSTNYYNPFFIVTILITLCWLLIFIKYFFVLSFETLTNCISGEKFCRKEINYFDLSVKTDLDVIIEKPE